MNEKNNTSKLRAIMQIANKKFIGLNKGSKMLLKIGALVFLAFLMAAFALSVLTIAGVINFNSQVPMIQWIVLYSFRFWIMMVFGALILDILIGRK